MTGWTRLIQLGVALALAGCGGQPLARSMSEDRSCVDYMLDTERAKASEARCPGPDHEMVTTKKNGLVVAVECVCRREP